MNDLIDIFKHLNEVAADTHKDVPKEGTIESAIYILEEDSKLLREKLKDRGDRGKLIATRKKITENAKAIKRLRRKIR